jgi:superfamily II DNA or RNA helicase
MARPTGYGPTNPAARRAVLERVPSLYALREVARALGLGDRLAAPLAAVGREVAVSQPARAVLAELGERHGIATVDALLLGADPTAPRWRASRVVRGELLDALVRFLGGTEETPAVAEAPPAAEPPWGDALELRAWAADRGLDPVLGFPAAALAILLDGPAADDVRRIEPRYGTVADVVLERSWSKPQLEVRLGRIFDELEVRARAFLRDLGRQADRADEEERQAFAAWGKPPADPAARALFDHWRELREKIRKATRPLPSSRITGISLRWEAAQAALVVTLEAPRNLWEPSERWEVTLPAEREEGHSPDCNCHRRVRPGEAACPHLLAALDAARLLLLGPADRPGAGPVRAQGEGSGSRADSGDPASADRPPGHGGSGGEEAGAALRAFVATPAWERTLSALDAALARCLAEAEEPEFRLSWRLSRYTVDGRERFALEPYRQKRRPSGGYTPGARLAVRDLRGLPQLLGERDRRALDILLAPTDAWYSASRREAEYRALLALRGHPLLFLEERLDRPLEIREAGLGIRAVPEDDGGLRLVASADGWEVPFDRLAALLEDAGPERLLGFLDDRALVFTVVRVPGPVETLVRTLAAREPRLPPEAVAGLVERADRLQAVLPVELPRSALGEEVPASRELVLRVEPGEGTRLVARVQVRPVKGGPALSPGEGPEHALARIGERRVFARRDFAREEAAAKALLATLPLPEEVHGFAVELEGDAALDLVAHLGERPPEPDVTVEWGATRRVTRRASGGDLRVEVTSQRDWFGLGGKLDVDGVEVELALALDAARRGTRYVEAAPGTWIALGEQLRKRLARAAEHAHVGKKGIEVSLAAAPAIEELALGGELRAVARFSQLLARIRAAREVVPEVPAPLAGVLRPYQVEGFRWLARLAAWGAGGCLADDMGLGKTLQALALLLHRREAGPALVIAPTSVCGNWLRETERFTAGGLRPVIYGALPEEERDAAVADLGPGDLLVASYGLVTRDAARLAGRRFATLILDEAQAVKNAHTARAKAVRGLDAEVTVALSGTPLENHLGELWSLFRIVLPGLLGSWERFRERFAAPIEKEKSPERRAALAELLRPFLLRRTKGEVARELPPRTEVDVPVELSPGERRLYGEARLAAAARVAGHDGTTAPDQRRFEILAAITRLRLCACHPRLYDAASTLPSSKLERLVEILGELKEGGHRALVFSQFTSQLALAREALDAAGIRTLQLDGSTPAATRQARVDAFQAGEADAFLISLKAGGTGLNLTAADYVIHLDPWWNPAVEDQATDRAHRIGQTKPVTVLRLIARGTIEEAILSLHGEKRELVAAVLEGSDGGVRLDTEALLALLEEAPAPAAARRPGEDGPDGRKVGAAMAVPNRVRVGRPG